MMVTIAASDTAVGRWRDNFAVEAASCRFLLLAIPACMDATRQDAASTLVALSIMRF
jgi:hypothetical protein